MIKLSLKRCLLTSPFIGSVITISTFTTSAWAQIVPVLNITGTIVSSSDKLLHAIDAQLPDIGVNLPYIPRLNLNTQQTTILLSSPLVQNIPGPLVDNNTSLINHLIQGQGSNTNLHLINSGGILPQSTGGVLLQLNGRLDVANAFMATQAIGVSHELVNVGVRSTLGDRTALNLLQGSLLQLETKSPLIGQGSTPGALTPLLPALLTGGNLNHANHIAVTLNGTVILTSVETPASPQIAASIGDNNPDGLEQDSSPDTIPQFRNTQGLALNSETEAFTLSEQKLTGDFLDHLTLSAVEKNISIATLVDVRAKLRQVASTKGIKPALLYVYFVPSLKQPIILHANQQNLNKTTVLTASNSSSKSESLVQSKANTKTYQAMDEGDHSDNNQDALELLLVTGDGQPIRKQLDHVTRAQVLQQVRQFQQQVTNATTSPNEYLPTAQQLYRWLIEPIKPDLDQHNIQNLAFILDNGLRAMPIAALHDGQQFLVEHYSISLMPSFSLTEFGFSNLHAMNVLAMGASDFQHQNRLPTVPLELANIANKLWSGEVLLNRAFTIQNLQSIQAKRSFGIVHLATHAKFLSGRAERSYIQFWDRKLYLPEVRQLGLHTLPVELLVLSACSTALGDEQAELGFAGMAVQAGVNSALASLWSVNDEATLALMTEFYDQLRTTQTKVEALRQAQIAMLKGNIHIENGNLITAHNKTLLPTEVADMRNSSFTHPIYWSAFTLIGNPW